MVLDFGFEKGNPVAQVVVGHSEIILPAPPIITAGKASVLKFVLPPRNSWPKAITHQGRICNQFHQAAELPPSG